MLRLRNPVVKPGCDILQSQSFRDSAFEIPDPDRWARRHFPDNAVIPRELLSVFRFRLARRPTCARFPGSVPASGARMSKLLWYREPFSQARTKITRPGCSSRQPLLCWNCTTRGRSLPLRHTRAEPDARAIRCATTCAALLSHRCSAPPPRSPDLSNAPSRSGQPPGAAVRLLTPTPYRPPLPPGLRLRVLADRNQILYRAQQRCLARSFGQRPRLLNRGSASVRGRDRSNLQVRATIPALGLLVKSLHLGEAARVKQRNRQHVLLLDARRTRR
jgi:hypothetical protein